jgi:branched-chain amino acid transport system ATP-binding protein
MDEVFRVFPALAAVQQAPAWRLSGGQQQMLAIGRALMRRARLILLDEPSLGLSPILAKDLFGRLRDLSGHGCAILVADQNATLALSVVDRAYVMQTGRIVAEGGSDELARSGALAAALFD